MILYLGLDPTRFPRQKNLTHYPIIRTEKIKPSAHTKELWPQFTHILFTSQTAVRYWFEEEFSLDKIFIAVGKATATLLKNKGVTPLIAKEETQEGVIALLEALSLKNGFLFWPKSKKARPVLSIYFKKRGVKHCILDLYDTLFQAPDPIPILVGVEEIVFTSPSTVQAFLKIYGALPKGVRLTALGPVTQKLLTQRNRLLLDSPQSSFSFLGLE